MTRTYYRSLTMAVVLLVASVASACGSDPSAAPTPSRSTEPAEGRSGSLAPARVELTNVARIDGIPTGLATRPGDDALYLTTREGLVVRVREGTTAKVILDLRDRVDLDGEGGMFDAAFTSDGRRLLVSYARSPSNSLEVVAFDVDPSGARHGDAERVIEIGDGGAIHHAGRLLVLPSGELLVGVGDGGELNDVAGKSRDPGSLRGRILRFPGLGRTGRAALPPEVAAFGLRNPWRFFRDSSTGTLWIGDVGQARWEEVDALADPAHADAVDFGWDLTEGFERARGLPPPGWREPELVVPHDAKHCAIVGGPIVRDRSLPALTGALVLGDYCSSDVRFVRLGEHGPAEIRRVALPGGARVVSFSEGTQHEVFVLRSDGVVSRLDPGSRRLAEDSGPVEVHPPPAMTGPESICGLSAALAGFPAMQGRPPAEVRRLAGDLSAALSFYRTTDLPAAARAPFRAIDGGLQDYLSSLRSADWDIDDPTVRLGPEATAQGAEAYASLARIEADTC